MAERDQVQHDDEPEDEDDETPSRDQPDGPIGPAARFTIGGKPLVLDDFIDITTGDLASRPRVEPIEQPPPAPKAVVWNSRRPLEE